MKCHFTPRDITGTAYSALIHEALQTQHAFSLTWAEGLTFHPSAHAVSEVLSPLELHRRRSDRWPGTRLFGYFALVVTYRVSEEARSTLLAPGSLFSWRSPGWPEDLAFYSRDRRCSLASIAHEHEAWLPSRALARRMGQLVTLEREDLDKSSLAIIMGAP